MMTKKHGNFSVPMHTPTKPVNRKKAHAVGMGPQFDFQSKIPGLRNKAIADRLQLWHDKRYGGSMRPNGAHYRGGMRPMVQGPTGKNVYRYAYDPDVADNDPNAPLKDLIFFHEWQASESRYDKTELGDTPNRWDPIKTYVRETLLIMWPNARFERLDSPVLREDEETRFRDDQMSVEQAAEILDKRQYEGQQTLDEEFAEVLTWAIENIPPSMPPAPPEDTAGMFRFFEDAKIAHANSPTPQPVIESPEVLEVE